MTAYQFSQPWLSELTGPQAMTASEFANLRKYLKGIDEGTIPLFNPKFLYATIDALTAGGNIAMGGFKLTGLGAGSTNGDSLRYEQVIGLYLLLAGGTMAGNIAMGSNNITGTGIINGNTINAGADAVAGTVNVYPATTVKGRVILSATDSGGNFTTTITNASQAASRIYSIPDGGADASFVLSKGTQTISGTKTFDGQLIGKGTATNDDAAAGYIGEPVRSQASTQSVGTSGQYHDITSISLTAGDWDVDVVATFSRGAATMTTTDIEVGIGTTTGNSAAGLTLGDNYVITNAVAPTTFAVHFFAISGYRISTASTITRYLKGYAEYSAGTPKWDYRISARRRR